VEPIGDTRPFQLGLQGQNTKKKDIPQGRRREGNNKGSSGELALVRMDNN